MKSRGEGRERDLPESVYFSDGYFQLPQLCSQAHQISDVGALKPVNVLEIGIGNGVTSSFLRRAGIDVLTVDINPNLKPDLCASIDELQNHLKGRQFDLIVCCEVLEHMPFSKFEESISIFKTIGHRLYLTLPNYKRSIGIGGFFRLRHSVRNLSFYYDLPVKKKLPEEHYWEVGYSKETHSAEIIKIIRRYYNQVSVKKYHLNPYHWSLTATQ